MLNVNVVPSTAVAPGAIAACPTPQGFVSKPSETLSETSTKAPCPLSPRAKAARRVGNLAEAVPRQDAPDGRGAAGRLANESVVGVGETGLDYFHDLAPRPAQWALFEEQLRLADEAKLPVVIHTRDADADTADVLAGFGAAPLLVDIEPHAKWPTVVTADAGHPMLTPILALHIFYRLAETVSRSRGRDPDQPPHLAKVTKTV